MAMSTAEMRALITGRIVKALEAGTKPWVRPWTLDPNSGHPTSVASRKRYQGINPILLDLTADEKSFTGKWWATFNQWKDQGGSVKPGEKATWVVLYKQVVKEREDGEKDKFPIMKMFPLFNIDQIAGSEVDKWRVDGSADIAEFDGDFTIADKLIKATNVAIKHGGNVAAYSTTSKGIVMPMKKKFDAPEGYYSTIFHELSHWADHQNGATMGKRFGDDDYSFGELVAEISACYLSEACNIPVGNRWKNSENYIGGWIKKMNDDHSFILKAASRASLVSDYILNLGQIIGPVEMPSELATA